MHGTARHIDLSTGIIKYIKIETLCEHVMKHCDFAIHNTVWLYTIINNTAQYIVSCGGKVHYILYYTINT